MDEIAQNKLDDYIMNRLNAEQRKAFELQLEQDVALQEALEIRRTMIDQIKTIGNLRMKDKILRIQEKVEAKKAKQSRIRIIRFVISAAAIVLLLVIGSRWINSSTSPQELYAQNYQAYELPFASRSETTDNRINEAGALYQQGAYEEALPLFEALAAEGQGTDGITMAIAICQLELKNYEQAISILEETSAQNGFLYQDQAQWYTALAHLQLNQVEESKAILQKVADQPHYFSKEIKALLKDLE